MFGNFAALNTRKDDSNEPREPPPPATPLDFPRCKPSKPSVPQLEASNDLVKLFSSTFRTGPTLKHLQALNVNLEDELSIEQVVPTGFVPNHSWSVASTINESSESPQTAASKSASLSNGAPTPGKNDFFVRVKELLHDNEDAFRAIQRKPPLPNRQPARIVHFRKFWDGLLAMAEHWDTSLDKYTDSKHTEETSAMDIDEQHPKSTKAEDTIEADKAEVLKKKKYTGRRRGTGRDMPGHIREDTTFSFVETLTWAFRCKLDQPNSQQRLKLQGTMIPILHAAAVHRVPRDIREARRRVSEGPMLGVFCREQTSFRDGDEAEGEGKQELLDLLRETGLMLMLAQKRSREGKEEEVPGKGEWWANAPRWGGGVGGELGTTNEETTGDATTSGNPYQQGQKQLLGDVSKRNQTSRLDNEQMEKVNRELHTRTTKSTAKNGITGSTPGKTSTGLNNKKASRLDAWKSMQPPSSVWERGVTYQQIGRDKESEYDDIYLVTSINHHVSILHLRIHLKYIDYLHKTEAQSKVSNAPQQPWYVLEMKRSRWFDLLVADDRVEAMRGVWAILGWQMRDMTEDKGESV